MRFIKKVSSVPLSQTSGEIIDSFNTSDNHTTNAPSLNAVEKNFSLKPDVLYDNANGSNGTITLSQNSSDYKYLEVYFFTNDGGQYKGYQKCMLEGNTTTYHSLIACWSNTSGLCYFKTKFISISGNTISNTGYAEVDLSEATSTTTASNNIYIRRVLGYK